MDARKSFTGVVLWLGIVCLASHAAAFVTLTHPDGYDTHAYGIVGTTITGFVGYKVITSTGYTDVPQHAFLYNTVTDTWTTLDYPHTDNSTRGDSIDGTKMVGFFSDWQGAHGFIYDITGNPDDPASWTTVNYGGSSTANSTFLYGIDGEYLTGRYINSEGIEVGFLYDGQGTWTTLNYPGAYKTRAYGVDVSRGKVAGFYQDTAGAHAYIYDMSRSPSDPAAWTSLDYPGSNWTFAYGIDGDNIVGRYVIGNEKEIGFVYNQATGTWTQIDYSNTRTYVCDIEGQILVGLYEDETGKVHGFQSSITPLPPTITSFMINNGARSTASQNVTLNNTATNDPAEYIASESSSFTGAQWLPYASAPSFTLSPVPGTKRVYFKVRSPYGESAVVRDTIVLAFGPEIAVSQADVPIPDGSGSFDFGSVPVNTITQVTFTIENVGDTVLNLTELPPVTLSGAGAADFTLSDAPANSIAAGGSTTFTITFVPTAAGARSASVSIANTDADENPYDFTLTGTGVVIIQPIPAIERQALTALYNSTDGDHWANNSGWKAEPLGGDGFSMPGTEDSWYGISILNATVTAIDLNSNQLSGALPPQLMNLSGLTALGICGNHLYTDDADLRAFLDTLQPDWEACQTPLPLCLPAINLLLLGD